MKRKTSLNETRIYRYECGPPTLNGDRVADEMRGAHRYSLVLAAIERERRQHWRAVMRDDRVAVAEARIAELDAEREGLRLAIKAAKAEARGRVDTDAATKARIRELGAEIKAARAERKAAQTAAKSDPRRAFFAAWLDAMARQEMREARAASGVYWGTYLLVEAAHDQARKAPTDSEWRRMADWDGVGRVGVQIQASTDDDGQRILGMTVDMLTSGTDQRARLSVPPQGKRGAVRLRVGSEGRDPVWSEWPVGLHRPLPADGVIKSLWVKREPIGARCRWWLGVVVETPPAPDRDVHGVVALDVGWRLRHDRALRVAYWHDDQGRHGEILLPGGRGGILDRHEHADSLREIQGRAFNAHRDRMVSWMRENEVPEWMRETTRALAQWRSAARLSDVIVEWRERRIDGDAEIFAVMEAWRKQHKHLHEWEVNERDKAQARRRDVYRNVAADLARRYRTVVLEDFDLRQVQRTPAPEREDPMHAKARYLQRVAALSSLRPMLAEKMRVVEVEAAGTSSTCADCGASLVTGDDLMVACMRCGVVHDQDRNAARNILARYASGSVPPESRGPLADAESSNSAGLGDVGADGTGTQCARS